MSFPDKFFLEKMTESLIKKIENREMYNISTSIFNSYPEKDNPYTKDEPWTFADFLLGRKSIHLDSLDRDIAIISNLSDEEYENSHDFIQYFFPIDVKSNFNPDAPLLDDDTIKKLKNESAYSRNIYSHKYVRFCKHLGFELFFENFIQNIEYKIQDFNLDKHSWYLNPSDHNRLRITRVIRHYYLLNKYEIFKNSFYDDLLGNVLNVIEDYGEEGDSVEYWKKAIT